MSENLTFYSKETKDSLTIQVEIELHDRFENNVRNAEPPKSEYYSVYQ